MTNPNLDVPCPTCGAEPGKRCRTLKTGRTTDTHNARWNQQWPADLRIREFGGDDVCTPGGDRR